MKFTKYHALGNAYIAINPADLRYELSADKVRLICHRSYGIGADGILLGPLESEKAGFALKIFNPDGSEAQTSGNGVRIFARWLVDESISGTFSFIVTPPGGPHACEVSPNGRMVTATMARPTFDSTQIPVSGPPREVLKETMQIDGRELQYCAVSLSNPHCVVLSEEPTPLTARRLGPQIEHDPRFPERCNVQFMRVLDRANIEIEIWERGAGYTLSSGSSSTAAAAAAHQLSLCDAAITVHMPGGELKVTFDEDFTPAISGPVTRVCHGRIAAEMFAELDQNGRILRYPWRWWRRMDAVATIEAMGQYDDFADYYDFDHAINFDVSFYRDYARRGGSPVLELACGTGRLLIPLAQAGLEVYGLDISPNMLAVCRKSVTQQQLNDRVHLSEAHMACFDLPRKDFSLVIVALRSFMHLLTTDDQRACLLRVFDHLRPGGLLLMDLIAPDPQRLGQPAGEPFAVRREFDLPDGSRVVRKDRIVAHDEINQVRHFEFLFEEYDPSGALVGKRLAPITTRYTHRDELQRLLQSAGLEIVDLFRDFYKQPYNGTGEMIVVARRPN